MGGATVAHRSCPKTYATGRVDHRASAVSVGMPSSRLPLGCVVWRRWARRSLLCLAGRKSIAQRKAYVASHHWLVQTSAGLRALSHALLCDPDSHTALVGVGGEPVKALWPFRLPGGWRIPSPFPSLSGRKKNAGSSNLQWPRNTLGEPGSSAKDEGGGHSSQGEPAHRGVFLPVAEPESRAPGEGSCLR